MHNIRIRQMTHVKHSQIIIYLLNSFLNNYQNAIIFNLWLKHHFNIKSSFHEILIPKIMHNNLINHDKARL